MKLDDVLITSDPAKLPADVAALLDPAVPLPVGVRFFETRFDVAQMLHGLLIAAGFALAAVVVIPFGVAMIRDGNNVSHSGELHFGILGFGLLCAVAAWMMLATIWTTWQLRARQLRGECTRRGTFLTPDALVQASAHDTTILPPARFRGIASGTVKYELRETPRTFQLPAAFVDATGHEVHDAIAAWAAPAARG